MAILPGRADDMRAEIVVRVAVDATAGESGRLHLSGMLVGPRRGRDMTLPTTVKLVEVTGDHASAAAAGHVLARAVFTEPAYWTPELPNLYRLEARVLSDGQPLAVVDRMIGLRRLGVRGRSLWLEGRRWVPRGATIPTVGFEPTSLRSLHTVAVVRDPSEDVGEAADRAGVAVIARLEDAAGRRLEIPMAVARIKAWALHPSVVLAVVPRTATMDAAAIVAASRLFRGTMLIGLEVDGTQPPEAVPATVAGGVDCLVVDCPRDGLPHAGWRAGGGWAPEKPLLAQRAFAATSVAEQRLECDRLQASLAAWGLAAGATQLPWDWAGYLSAAW